MIIIINQEKKKLQPISDKTRTVTCLRWHCGSKHFLKLNLQNGPTSGGRNGISFQPNATGSRAHGAQPNGRWTLKVNATGSRGRVQLDVVGLYLYIYIVYNIIMCIIFPSARPSFIDNILLLFALVPFTSSQIHIIYSFCTVLFSLSSYIIYCNIIMYVCV